MVGSMRNLVNEVLQAAVGNHFRDNLQSMPAIRFIETRQQVQQEAFSHIRSQLEQYQVETKGVYIQDVVFPGDLVTVLTEREIANQEIETYRKQRAAEDERVEMEKAKGTADMQAELARSKVGVAIKQNNADARIAEAGGEAEYIRQTGIARGAEVEAVGVARAKGYEAQVRALGAGPTAVRQRGDGAGRERREVHARCAGQWGQWRGRARRACRCGDEAPWRLSWIGYRLWTLGRGRRLASGPKPEARRCRRALS